MIAVIGAMIEEITPFKEMLVDVEEIKVFDMTFYKGKYQNHDIVLVLSGIGKVNAAVTTTILCERFKPQYILNIGTAGGINKELSVGDLVVGDRLVYHDVDVTHFNYEYGQVPKLPLYFESDKYLLSLTESIKSELTHNMFVGLIATGDAFMGREDQLVNVNKQFATCLAVEMEACAIAQTAYLYNVPFIVCRSISDVAGKESHVSFNEYLSIAANNSTLLLTSILNKL